MRDFFEKEGFELSPTTDKNVTFRVIIKDGEADDNSPWKGTVGVTIDGTTVGFCRHFKFDMHDPTSFDKLLSTVRMCSAKVVCEHNCA